MREFLSRFYDWQPDITPEQCEQLGLHQVANWRLRGQQIAIYVRSGVAPAQPFRSEEPHVASLVPAGPRLFRP